MATTDYKKALDYFSDTGVAADVQLAATPDFFMGHFAAALEFGAPEYGVGGSVQAQDAAQNRAS